MLNDILNWIDYNKKGDIDEIMLYLIFQVVKHDDRFFSFFYLFIINFFFLLYLYLFFLNFFTFLLILHFILLNL